MPGFRLRSTQPYERQIVATILKGLVARPDVAWCARMNTGAAKGNRFVRFGFVGLSDIIGQMRDGRLIAIECKRKGGERTDAQQAFLHWVHCAGGLAGFATSMEDAITILTGTPPQIDSRITQSGPCPVIKCLSNPKAPELNLTACSGFQAVQHVSQADPKAL